MKNKYYYGFEYSSRENTTYGDPNKTTGRFSIAGTLRFFKSIDTLNEWLDFNNNSKKRVQLKSLIDVRSHHLGMDLESYNWMIESLKEDAE